MRSPSPLPLAVAAGLAWALALPTSALAEEAAADAAPAGGVEEVRACMEENAPETSAAQWIRFEAVDRGGSSTVSEAELYWKRFGEDESRALARFASPPDVRGSALLLVQGGDQSDMFMYLPELKRVRRVTGRTLQGSMFGTDLSYEDFERLQGMVDDHSSTRLPDAEVDGRPVSVLQAEPGRGADSQYSRVVSFVDRETCLPLRTELYEGDELSKVATTSREDMRKEASGWVPTRIRMEDRVDGTHTVVEVTAIETEVELRDRLFSQMELEKGRVGSPGRLQSD